MRLLAAQLAVALLAGCASAPTPAPGRAAAFGYVRLVPHEGVTPQAAGSHSYGDRELEGVSFVDYSKPGFAVVYAAGAPRAEDRVALAIRPGPAHAVLDPPDAALGVGGTVAIANQSSEAHVVSCPAAKLVKRLAPGESVSITAATAGEWPVHLLDVPGEQARIFAAPGPYRVVSSSGRFELSDLEPGRVQLHAWHPRFPSASRSVDLAAGQSVRVDIDLQVGAPEEGADDAR